MKLSAGVLFMVAVLLGGAASLAGGQVWVLTGSLAVAGGAGVLALVGLALAFRLFLRRARAQLRVRFLGEAAEGPNEAEFVEVSEAAAAARGEIERGVRHRPERVAGSIRTLLGKGAPRRS